MQLEEIDCPVCAVGDYELLFKAKDYRLRLAKETFNIVECRKCGFIFLNPRPLREALLNFYPVDFHKNDSSFLYKAIEPCFALAQKNSIRILKKYQKQGRLLDVGCGNGNFIHAMQNNGFDVSGVELNLEAQKYVPLDLKGRIFFKELRECKFADKSFEIITMFHSLEHVADIRNLLEEVRRIIKDKGIFFICVPNADFFESRIFGPYYYNLEVPRHLYFFNQKTLCKLLATNGFVPIKVIKEDFSEWVLTPASFYHGLWNLFSDKYIFKSRILKLLSFIPLVLVKILLRIIFIFDSQNVKIVFQKSDQA